MARAELVKKLLSSYGRDEEFRAVAEQIIEEEERKNNRVLAQSLRRTLEGGSSAKASSSRKPLAPLIQFPNAAADYIERVEPSHTARDIVLNAGTVRTLLGLIKEFRRSDEIRRRGLSVRSKLLFCGPPGCGKTLCAEVFAKEIGLPLFIVKLDRLISSYLGETAANVRKVFEFSRKQPCILLFDEFDALARSREDALEHNELRRVVNSLLIFIDRIQPNGFLIAATNLEGSLDQAVWRRFDEVIWFEKPSIYLIARFLRLKFRNVEVEFDVTSQAPNLLGFAYADLERICIQAIKTAILDRRKAVRSRDFAIAMADQRRRQDQMKRLTAARESRRDAAV